MGARGLLYYEEQENNRLMPALDVPDERIIDTNGAGDIFHGAYVYSYLTRPAAGWEEHFRFARAASAHAIQRLGNEASLPTLADIKGRRPACRAAGGSAVMALACAPVGIHPLLRSPAAMPLIVRWIPVTTASSHRRRDSASTARSACG